MKAYVCIISCFLLSIIQICSSVILSDTIIGSIDKEYAAVISNNSIHIYEFSFPVQSFRIETAVFSNDTTSPIEIYASHQSYVEAWSLPTTFYSIPDEIITTTSRTACPSQLNNTVNFITVRVQTFSVNPIRYKLKVSRFYPNQIQIDQQATTSISSSFSAYFVLDIPFDIPIVEVHLNSVSELCSLVRIASFSCPPDFTKRSSRQIPDYEMTMRGVADLRVRRSDFLEGRMAVFLIPLPAIECQTSVEFSTNISSPHFQKNISLVVNAGSTEFWVPILVMPAIFFLAYVLFAFIIGFELIIARFFPKLMKHFSLFLRIPISRAHEDNDNVSEQKHVELQEVAETGEMQSITLDQQMESSVENPAGSSSDYLEMYKSSISNGVLNNRVRGAYYYNIINEKEIALSDLNLSPLRYLNRNAVMYIFLVIIVGVFYFIPGLQVVYLNHEAVRTTGIQDICYFNYKCAHELNSILAFNSIWSNVSYFLLSFLFFIIVVIKNISFMRELKSHGLSTTGIPQVFGLYYSLALALFFEGIMSCVYHLCPSLTNYQFDTTFMYIIATMLFIRLYKNRNPEATIYPFAIFVMLSIAVFFTYVTLFRQDNDNFPGRIILTLALIVFTLVEIYLIYNLFLSNLPYYYYKDWLNHKSILRVLRQLFWPLYNKSRIFLCYIVLVLSLIVLTLLWIPDLLDTVSSAIFYLFILHVLLYTLYYWIQKFAKKEFLHRPFVFVCVLLMMILTFALWAFALYFWGQTSIHWEESPAVARELNNDCIFLNFYDDHDIWHVLSAFAIFMVFITVLLIDENLVLVQQDKIRVF
ncbi:SID1 transmembrane family member 2 isoform X2 [Oopsacas minuta]|uniref:SID1 transmembrane family member 2 isoform X2 n=1 Tax=Oopsacas minuta TaxID=111878 RepID=A0AAV7JB96_9METZ|nr:SID1 transmembrane family member 2 isoform X2 [Oopsacas minuta]